MKAEITRTRLVEQPSTERPQSQIVSLILTHSPPKTLGLTVFCFSPPRPFSFILFLYLKNFLIFFLSLSLSLSFLAHLLQQKHENHLISSHFSNMSAFALTYFFHFLCLHSLSSLLPCVLVSFFPCLSPRPMQARSPLKPLCSMSPLTTAVTL